MVPTYSSATVRFEVDGANAARDFLRRHRIAEQDITQGWTAIALPTTPGIPQYMHPVVALLTAGVEIVGRGKTHTGFTPSTPQPAVYRHTRRPAGHAENRL